MLKIFTHFSLILNDCSINRCEILNASIYDITIFIDVHLGIKVGARQQIKHRSFIYERHMQKGMKYALNS